MRRLTIAAALLALAAAASPAEAATLVNRDGKLTYAAAGAKPVSVSFTYGNTDYVGVLPQPADEDPITTFTGCTVSYDTFTYYTCPGVKSIVATGGSGDDDFQPQDLAVPITVDGGAGDDYLVGGKSADILLGGPGDDNLIGEAGDTVRGGSGVDSAVYRPPGNQAGPVRITLDDVADDGTAGDQVNFFSDIENVDADGRFAFGGTLPVYGPVTLTGTEGANDLAGSSGPDVIAGAGGIDTLEGKGGDDVLLARDGFADRVHCGAGTDTAVVDALDEVSDTCEIVQREGVLPAKAGDDTPPRIAWLSGLAISAEDDHGIASVRWFAGQRLLCTVTAAPFDCALKAQLEDVGLTTITVIATDTAAQTTSLVKAVTVERFMPTAVTLKVKRSGRRYTASGIVRLPAGVPCSGSVTVVGRTATLRRDCSYRVVVPRSAKYVAKFLGTDGLAPRASKAVKRSG